MQFSSYETLSSFSLTLLNLARYYRLIAKGRYEINGNSAAVQNFKVIDDSHRQADQPFQAVSLRVLSNHGNPSFTCLYRFRVHGIPLP